MCHEAMMRRRLAMAATVLTVSAGSGAAEMRALPGASIEVQGIRYSHPSSIRYAPEEHLFYVADTGNRRIVLLTTTLEPLDALSMTPLGLRPFCALPVGDGSMWVSDLDRPDLFRVDARGNCVDTLRLGALATPGRMAWEAAGRLLVIDRASRTVLRVQPALRDARPESLAVPGDGVIEDVAALPGGRIAVVSATGSAIWEMDTENGRWTSWGEHGVGREQFSFPVGLCPDRSGGVWIVDAFRHEARLLSAEGKVRERIVPEPGREAPLQFPVSAGQAAGDTIAVLERGACRVQRFARLP
jgi:hypothetical protein